LKQPRSVAHVNKEEVQRKEVQIAGAMKDRRKTTKNGRTGKEKFVGCPGRQTPT